MDNKTANGKGGPAKWRGKRERKQMQDKSADLFLLTFTENIHKKGGGKGKVERMREEEGKYVSFSCIQWCMQFIHTSCEWTEQEKVHEFSANCVSSDCDAVRVSAESFDVVSNPL